MFDFFKALENAIDNPTDDITIITAPSIEDTDKTVCTSCNQEFTCCLEHEYHQVDLDNCKIDFCTFCDRAFHHLDCMGVLNEGDGTPFEWNRVSEIICERCNNILGIKAKHPQFI